MSREETRINGIIQLLHSNQTKASSGYDAVLGVAEKDDCAVIPISNESDLVVASDFIRGCGFYLFKENIMDWFDIGYYLVAANASDLAAMGARPTGFLSVIRYTEKLSDGDFEQIALGITTACHEFNMPLLGGDIGGYNEIVLSGTAMGICKKNQYLKRSGGMPGDQLFLTGHVGLAATAVAYFTKIKKIKNAKQLSPSEEAILAQSWKRVSPALLQAQLIVDKQFSCCGIDTSDGLKASLRQVAEASGLDAVVNLNEIPVDNITHHVAFELNIDPYGLALGDSVDFRLLFSTPRSKVQSMVDELKKQNFDVYRIGELRKPIGMPGAWHEINGNLWELPGIEWDQSEIHSIDRLVSGSNQDSNP